MLSNFTDVTDVRTTCTRSMMSSRLVKWCVLQPSARSTSSWVACFLTAKSRSSAIQLSWGITTDSINSSWNTWHKQTNLTDVEVESETLLTCCPTRHFSFCTFSRCWQMWERKPAIILLKRNSVYDLPAGKLWPFFPSWVNLAGQPPEQCLNHSFSPKTTM